MRHPHGHGGTTKERALRVFGLLNSSALSRETCPEAFGKPRSRGDDHHKQLERNRAAVRAAAAMGQSGTAEAGQLDAASLGSEVERIGG